nr:uncharacterized mitochondrial protein AtMg00810-like [Tanacetum cinerariifolium]
MERRNRTLVEAARTMLTFTNLPSFLWAEAIAIACFTQNHSIIHKCFDKTPYELINKRKPNIQFFRVFGCRCYLLNDYEDVGKLKKKRDIGVFVGYLKESAAFRIYNKRTRKIHKSVNVNFDEISEMASKQFSLEPSLSNLNETGKSSNPPVSKEVFHEVSESFQGKSSTSSLNDDVQQSPEEVILPSSNTQSIPINMVPNGDEASTSNNVFNERLDNAYFDAIPTPMVEQAKLKLDLIRKPVDHTVYRSMIGSLMYVTSSRPDIMFATCMCARYQANPNEHHVPAVKRIFRYLKGTINLGLWYPKDSGFDLTAYSDADHAGCHLDIKRCHLDRKSTSGSVQFLGDKLVCWSSKKQNCVSISIAESEYVAV